MNTLILLSVFCLTGASSQSYSLAGLYNPFDSKSDAIFVNPALLPDSRFSGVLGLRQNYLMSDLTDFHLSVSGKFWKLRAGLGLLEGGIKDIVSDYTFLAGLGMMNSFFGAGLSTRVGYLKNIEDNLTASSFSIDYGLCARLSIFEFTFSHLNALRPSRGFTDKSEKSESEMLFMISFQVPQSVTWMLGLDRTSSKTSYRIGSEMWFTRGFGLRIGLMDREVRLGLCLKTDTYGIDVAFGSSRELGTTVVISTNYSVR
ncbi:MAG: hypothetical protein KA126_06005 [Candidatus Hydrothermae bacterium]|nr:hypothetical protein [Candidatus Hydrothermae bacterium]